MYKQSLLNCEKALQKLNEFLAVTQHLNKDYTQAAVIQAFEFTFEVFRKTFQKIGRSEGIAIGSPKSAFSFAYQSGLIEDENIWLDLLNDRNMTTHSYHEIIAQKIFSNIKEKYVFVFQKAYQILFAKLSKE